MKSENMSAQNELLNEILELSKDCSPLPWRLDQYNNQIVDNVGFVVFYEEFDAPNEVPSHIIENKIKESHANAKLIVKMSQWLLFKQQHPNL